MKTMHLFAGIGGGLLADLILGHDPIIAVEWDGYACSVLRERAKEGWFPNLSVWEGDVRLFNPSEYTGKVDCIHAGFPCQDISVAGKQAGVGEGTRSGLYREVLRIAGIVRPRYLFLENVAAITSKGLDQVLKDLAEMGYDTRWCCLRASDVGAPHHRDRWWCRAVRNTEYDGQSSTEVTGSTPQGSNYNTTRQEQTGELTRPSDAEVLAYPKHNGFATCAGQYSRDKQNKRGPEEQGCIKQSERSDTQSCLSANVPDTLLKGLERQREISCGTGKELGDSGDSCWWSVESNVGRVANGIPHRVQRLKGLGNAQVPLQAAVAWRLLGGE